MFKPDFLIDIHWLNRISHKLDRFKRISLATHVYECRCPVCGDSKKNKRKARCHFYEKKRSLNVHCKNCGYSRSFYNFMSDVFPLDFVEYKKEQLHESIERLKQSQDDSKRFDRSTNTAQRIINPVAVESILDDVVDVLTLPKTHPARQYLESRKFDDDQLSKLLYTDNFKSLATKLSYQPLSENFPDDDRIIIPFYNESGSKLELIQGRCIGNTSRMRYITIKSHPDAEKIFGLNAIDRDNLVYCVEGPFDSLFIDNCIATCDSNLTRATQADVYIFDNEPRNKEIVGLIAKAIDENYTVVIWPTSPNKKVDINQMIIDDMTRNDLMKLIREHSYYGAMAKLKFTQWKRV